MGMNCRLLCIIAIASAQSVQSAEADATCTAENAHEPACRQNAAADGVSRTTQLMQWMSWLDDLPFFNDATRSRRGQGPFLGEADKLNSTELEQYYAARAHQPWRRPPRSHRPYGVKIWDVFNCAVLALLLGGHALAVAKGKRPTLAGFFVRLVLAHMFVDFLTGFTHAVFDGRPWLVPFALRLGAGRLAPIHEHRDTATICSFTNSELLADMQPTIIVELVGSHLIARGLGYKPDHLFLMQSALIGIWTGVVHKIAHLRGRSNKHPDLVVDATSRFMFELQDWGIIMSHEAHRSHHQTGVNPCLMVGGFNWLFNYIVAEDDKYARVPTLRMEQPVYDIAEIELVRSSRMQEWYGQEWHAELPVHVVT